MFDNIKPPCEAFAAVGEQDELGATAFATIKLMVVFERPRMVAHFRRPGDEPRASVLSAGGINQPSANGPTKAAKIFASGKYAPAQSPNLTSAPQSAEPRRELEPRPRDVATSPPALRVPQPRADDCRTTY